MDVVNTYGDDTDRMDFMNTNGGWLAWKKRHVLDRILLKKENVVAALALNTWSMVHQT